jgi:hypothetical protein
MPAVLVVLQFRCALEECGATWRILPAFLARHVWHAWKVVERVARPASEAPPLTTTGSKVAARTRGRWLARLSSSARVLVAVLAISAGVVLEEIAQRVGLMGTRGELIEAYVAMTAPPASERLSSLAALVHRLERGIRLM